MKAKFKKADYLLRFISRVINEFQKGKDHGNESFIILLDWFWITKPFISIENELDEIKSKHFLKWFR